VNEALCVYATMCCVFQQTQSAVDDYNRARAYLADIANRDGVPVHSNITEALSCVLELLKD